MKYLSMAVLALYASHLFAGDATSCIQITSNDKSQMMKNTCPEPVVVFWCHSLKAECGKGDRYYQLNTVIEPNKESGNLYSTPLGVTIDFGACYGDYSSYKYTDKIGGYACKPPKVISNDTVVMTTTASGSTEAEACNQAKAIAGKNKTIGECSCQNRGSRFICKVQSKTAKPDGSIINQAKDQIKEKVVPSLPSEECKPTKLYKCTPKNVGTGVKG